MPRTRQQAHSQSPPSINPPEVVDLTDSTPVQPRTDAGKRKRAEEDALVGPSSKRTAPAEQISEPTSSEGERTQTTQKEPSHTPIGAMSCIICMESYTNATVAHCGHIFCHECLSRALMASEANNSRAIGNCPSCRKPISRKRGKQIIPIQFMKRSKFRRTGR